MTRATSAGTASLRTFIRVRAYTYNLRNHAHTGDPAFTVRIRPSPRPTADTIRPSRYPLLRFHKPHVTLPLFLVLRVLLPKGSLLSNEYLYYYFYSLFTRTHL